MKHLIIGNGIAGINAARAIREMDSVAEIVMVGDESFPPYSRPSISYVLDGSQLHEKLPLFHTDIYKDFAITPLLGQRVKKLKTREKYILLEDDNRVEFDRLLIASGADARKIQVEGATLDNIFCMRTEKDVTGQLQAIDGGVKAALVLGGGLVGFKAAHGLLKRGMAVTMLITSGYPLAMQVDQTAGAMIKSELEKCGLTVKVGVSVTRFEGMTKVQGAVLDSGETLSCDLVIVGKGVDPSLDYIAKDEIKVGYGVIVDDYLQTSTKNIFAAGDVVEAVDIARGSRWINAIWPEAATQGRIAGFNMAGRRVSYPGSLSRNVMRVYDLDIMTLGLANPGAEENLEIIRTGAEDLGWYRSLVFRDNILVGAVLVNRIEQGGILRALIENRVPITIPKTDLASPAFNFATLTP